MRWWTLPKGKRSPATTTSSIPVLQAALRAPRHAYGPRARAAMANLRGHSSRLLAPFVLVLAGATAAIAAESYEGYGWGYSDNADGPSLVLGSTERPEDFVFLLSCSNAD